MFHHRAESDQPAKTFVVLAGCESSRPAEGEKAGRPAEGEKAGLFFFCSSFPEIELLF